MSVRCGRCKNLHEMVSEVRSCYAKAEGREASIARHPAGRKQERPAEPATERQRDFILSLGFRKVVPIAGNTHEEAATLDRIKDVLEQGSKPLGKREASDAISYLLGLMDKPATKTLSDDFAARQASSAKPVPVVLSGHYAVGDNGVVKFYKVDKVEQGKWAGRTFVKVQASDDYWPIKGFAGEQILKKIAADPRGAMQLYGDKLGRCAICNRTLTDELSRLRGIGPICWGKTGWDDSEDTSSCPSGQMPAVWA